MGSSLKSKLLFLLGYIKRPFNNPAGELRFKGWLNLHIYLVMAVVAVVVKQSFYCNALVNNKYAKL